MLSQSIMVREMLAEINISYISKAFVQTVLRAIQLYVYILLRFLLVMTPSCAEIFLHLYCFDKGANGIMSECFKIIIVAPFQVEQHNGSHSGCSTTPWYLSMMNLNHSETFFCSFSPILIARNTIISYAYSCLAICRVDSDDCIFFYFTNEVTLLYYSR